MLLMAVGSGSSTSYGLSKLVIYPRNEQADRRISPHQSGYDSINLLPKSQGGERA